MEGCGVMDKKSMKMQALQALIEKMHKLMAGGMPEEPKSNMDIAKLDEAGEGPGPKELAMSDAEEKEEGEGLSEEEKEFFTGKGSLPKASGITVQAFGMGNKPTEGTKAMLKEMAKSKKLSKFA